MASQTWTLSAGFSKSAALGPGTTFVSYDAGRISDEQVVSDLRKASGAGAGGTAYPSELNILVDGVGGVSLDLEIGQTPTDTGNNNRELSDAWETGGTLTLTNGTRSVTIQAPGSSDRNEPYTWSNQGTNAALTDAEATALIAFAEAAQTNQAGTLVLDDGQVATAPARGGTPTTTPGDGSGKWVAAAPDDGGSAITGYQWRYKLTSAQAWTSSNESSNTLNLSGLTNGSVYEAQFKAVNSVGAAAQWSPSGALTPRASLPVASAPQTVTIGPVADGDEGTTVKLGATVTKGTGLYDTGPVYAWTVRQGNTDVTSAVLDDATLASPTFTRPQVSADTDYTVGLSVTVRGNGTTARNGTSATKAATAVTTTVENVPAPPVATVPARGTAPAANASAGRIAWTATAPNNGGAAITGYDWRWRRVGTQSWTTISTTGRTLTRTGLTAGQRYEAQFKARNRVGAAAQWSPSGTATVPTTSLPAPTPPTVVINPVPDGNEGVGVRLTARLTGGSSGVTYAYAWTIDDATTGLDDATSASPLWTRPSVTSDTDYDIDLRVTVTGDGESHAGTATADAATVSSTVTDLPSSSRWDGTKTLRIGVSEDDENDIKALVAGSPLTVYADADNYGQYILKGAVAFAGTGAARTATFELTHVRHKGTVPDSGAVEIRYTPGGLPGIRGLAGYGAVIARTTKASSTANLNATRWHLDGAATDWTGNRTFSIRVTEAEETAIGLIGAGALVTIYRDKDNWADYTLTSVAFTGSGTGRTAALSLAFVEGFGKPPASGEAELHYTPKGDPGKDGRPGRAGVSTWVDSQFRDSGTPADGDLFVPLGSPASFTDELDEDNAESVSQLTIQAPDGSAMHAFLTQVEQGDIVVMWLDDANWIDYLVTSRNAVSSGFVVVNVRHVEHRLAGGIPNGSIRLGFSKAPKGVAGRPAAGTILNYDDIGNINNNGGYQFREADKSGIGGNWSDVRNNAAFLRIGDADSDGNDTTKVIESVEPGEVVTWLVGDHRWMAWEVTSNASVTGGREWGIELIAEDETGNTGAVSINPGTKVKIIVSADHRAAVAAFTGVEKKDTSYLTGKGTATDKLAVDADALGGNVEVAKAKTNSYLTGTGKDDDGLAVDRDAIVAGLFSGVSFTVS